jgi:hypothetical protein
MKESLFEAKLKMAKQRAQKRSEEALTKSPFGSWARYMSAEERKYVAEAQSRAMKEWWSKMTPWQREEMGRRISEGLMRAQSEVE